MVVFMDFSLWSKGLVIGFSIAAPVGPIGVLCIRRTLAQGRASGLVSGLGAATADAVYGCIAGFGLTSISSLLITQESWLRLCGGTFLCYLGIKAILTKPSRDLAPASGDGLIGNYFSTFFLTLTNPFTIVFFAAIFSGLGLVEKRDHLSAVALVSGVFVGSALWWLTLSSGAAVLRKKLTPAWSQWINRISGLVITGFGLLILLSPRG
jgi:threonine/homoserine/homoserine lactone efflux protein